RIAAFFGKSNCLHTGKVAQRSSNCSRSSFLPSLSVVTDIQLAGDCFVFLTEHLGIFWMLKDFTGLKVQVVSKLWIDREYQRRRLVRYKARDARHFEEQ